jgi:hypothetical protein
MYYILYHFTDCEIGHHGENCTQECGHCTERHECDTTTGACLNGCLPNWSGSRCDGQGNAIER